MTAKIPRRHLDVSNLPITKQQLIQLLKIEFSLIWVVGHDMNGHLQAISNASYLSLDDTKDLIAKVSQNPNPSLFQAELNNIKDTLEMLFQETKRFSFLLDNMSGFRSVDPDELFVSRPYYIVQSIKNIYPKVNIQIDKHSWKSLEIIYPEHILLGMVKEIIQNAIKNCGDNCTILINWKMQSSRFHFEIHDNGSGVFSGLGKSFVPFSDFAETVSPSRQFSGLRMISRIIYHSAGNFLFKKSDLLGGTLVFIELPTYGYYQKGQIHDLSQE